MKRFLVIILVAAAFLLPAFIIRADELDDITAELASLNDKLEGQEADYDKLNDQLEGIKSRVAFIEQEIVKKEKEVKEGEAKLSDFVERLSGLVKEDYKNATKANPLFEMIAEVDLQSGLNSLFYTQSVTEKVKNEIIKIVTYINDLEKKKAELAREKEALIPLKEEIDRQSQILAGEISSTRGKIAELSAKQQSLIASRLAALNIPRSAGTSAKGCADDRGIDPGFSPRVAFFTYGAPHRNGLNQYGAWGRAKDGQNEEAILSAYYPNMSLNKGYDQNAQINVDGHGSFSIEDYVKRIYEMPDSWTDNNSAALKAQAVAARTYALNRMQANGHICTTEACQVFKPEPKGGNWEQAVNATAGWVMMDGGSPGFTQYASTHGGYILNLGRFDGRIGNPGNFSELDERAYDKESPWFYCDWGARGQYSNTAWLRPAEVADIANVILLVRRDSSTGEHLYQTDKPHPYGGEIWNEERVKQELRNRGGTPYNSASSVSIGADFGSGRTNTVTVSGDAGSNSFSGDEFKNWFNLRAPANIQIVGPLYNAEIR